MSCCVLAGAAMYALERNCQLAHGFSGGGECLLALASVRGQGGRVTLEPL